ncbi:MAG: rod shape-determining protein MreD [Pseudomonadota bacterium]|nr:MAG: rod shape-determining protein MreD [Pseudomonadota bacterium]
MNLSSTARARIALAMTFVVALLLTIMPGPAWAEAFRPDWVGMVLIYWVMAAPQRVGVGTGWVLGFVLDVLQGAVLGSNALAKALIAFLTLKLHLKLRMFPRWQQAVAVLVLLLLNQLLVLWIRGFVGRAPETWVYWTPSIVGMLVWPWLFVVLRDLRRRHQIA